MEELATFAGGCFWCIEAAFFGVTGVISVVSGYIGGKAADASYEKVCSGVTSHREAVQVSFDSSVISYSELLTLFWRQIDPTDSGGQFADRGHQYTTAIYYHDSEQQQLAIKSLKEQDESDRFNETIVTKILPFTDFFKAEEEHQNYAHKRALHYKLYKEGSGRGPYLRSVWGK